MTVRYLVAAVFALPLPAAAPMAYAQVTCLRQFDQIICSDGRNGLITPDGTLWSDGSSVYRPNRDQIFINPAPDGSLPPVLDTQRRRPR